MSYKSNAYIFTATCMFSKLLFSVSISSKDAITVSSALYNLFTTFGGCGTIPSDQGTEFTAQVTSEVCRLMGLSQQFTPVPYLISFFNKYYFFCKNFLSLLNTFSLNAWIGFAKRKGELDEQKE